MTQIYWKLPVLADVRGAAGESAPRGHDGVENQRLGGQVRDIRGGQFNAFDHLAQIARAAEIAGLDGLIAPADPHGDDSWITITALARETRRLRLVATLRPSWGSAVYAGKMAVTVQRFSGGRLGWHLDLSGEAAERLAAGDPLVGADRQLWADEFLTVSRGVFTTAPFNFKGRFFEVQDGGFKGPLAGQPFPQIVLSGQDPHSLDLSVRHADVHLLGAVTPAQAAANIEQVERARKGARGDLRYGVDIEIIARETAKEAQAAAGSTHSQPGLVVGDYAQVAATLDAYSQIGVGLIIATAKPALGEINRLAQQVLPLTAAAKRKAA